MLVVNYDPYPTLSTERLVLREIVPADAGDIIKLRSDKTAMHYIPRPLTQTQEEADALIAMLDKFRKDGEAINWGIALKEDNEVIGTIGLLRGQKEHYRLEVGYMLRPDHWRKGISHEALKAVLDYGFNTLQLHSIEAVVNPKNTPSSALLEKTGFVKEAHFKENFFHKGQFEDTAVYSLLRSNFKL